MQNNKLKNAIGGKGTTCGSGAGCDLACTTLSGSKRCAIVGPKDKNTNKNTYFDVGWGCIDGSAVAPCLCGSFTNPHLCT